MFRKSKQKRTLIETIVSLADSEPSFSSVDGSKVRVAGDEFYETIQNMCGEFLVSRGTLTRGQLEIALGVQAEEHGDHTSAIEHVKRAAEEIKRLTQQTVLTLATEAELHRGN